jgi:hypothetical protein
VSVLQPNPEDRNLSGMQLAELRQLQIIMPATGAAQYLNPSGIEKIDGNRVRSVNQFGVVVYVGGTFKELIPWHRIHKLIYHTRDPLVNGFPVGEDVHRGR